MNIKIHWNGDYADITVETANTSIWLGLQDEAERQALAEHLRDAADELAPPDAE